MLHVGHCGLLSPSFSLSPFLSPFFLIASLSLPPPPSSPSSSSPFSLPLFSSFTSSSSTSPPSLPLPPPLPSSSDYKEYHTDTTVKFVVTLSQEKMQEAERIGFHKKFKLESSLNTSNMVSNGSKTVQ